jgi:uncharacterized damage-inducible protein DinB
MSSLRLARVLLVALAFSIPAFAQDAGSMPAPAAPAGFRADLIGVLSHVEQQTVSLEQAMPQTKFAWRPAKGVRSVSEAYLHIAEGIYELLGPTGHEMPADVKALSQAKKFETQTKDKNEVKTILTTAYAYARKAIAETSDADLDKTVSFFGRQMSERAVLLVLLSHCSEHLGQSIAYARMNGVVPPWNKPDHKD